MRKGFIYGAVVPYAPQKSSKEIWDSFLFIYYSRDPGSGFFSASLQKRQVGYEFRTHHWKSKELRVPFELIQYVHDNGKLPVPNFAAGGVATPADAALMMQLGAEGVFVGSGIFKSGDPMKRAKAIVNSVANYNNPSILAELSEDLGEAMVGINENEIKILMAERGK